MKGNTEVISYLNRGLASELMAIHQYWLHYRLIEDWGFIKLANFVKTQAKDEMHHADDFIARILFLEGAPDIVTMDKVNIGKDIKSILANDLEAEYSAVKLYTEAIEVCERNHDNASKQLFEKLVADEESHVDWLETQLGLIDKLGLNNYCLLQAKTDA